VTVVVDVGCHAHPEHQGQSQDSVTLLVERFRPTRLIGFDPQLPGLIATRIHSTRVMLYPVAAWTHDGEVDYDPSPATPLSASVGVGLATVACVNLAAWIPNDTVLKIDAQGSEYPLLEHLLDADAMERVTRLLVEWHPVDGWEARRDRILERLTCPVEEWEL